MLEESWNVETNLDPSNLLRLPSPNETITDDELSRLQRLGFMIDSLERIYQRDKNGMAFSSPMRAELLSVILRWHDSQFVAANEKVLSKLKRGCHISAETLSYHKHLGVIGVPVESGRLVSHLNLQTA